MTKFKRHLAFSTTAMLIASLAACSKHTLRETPKAATALSTSANPLKAENEDALVAQVETVKELTDEEKDEALLAVKKAQDARAAGKALAVAEVADLFAKDVQGAQIIEIPAEVPAEVADLFPKDVVPPAKAAGAPAAVDSKTAPTTASTVAPVVIDGGSAPVATAPIAETPGSKRFSIVLPVFGSRGGGTEVAATVETTPIASVAVADQAIVKHAFVKALIAPTLRLNAQTMLQRQRVVAAQKKIADKVELSDSEKADIAKLKVDYLLLDSKSTLEDLLTRVDVVQMSFLIAPLAVKTKWNTEGQVTESLIASRIQELNVSMTEDKVRFRSARLALKSAKNVVESVELMKSFLGYSAADKNLTHEALMAAVTEIAAMTQEPEMIAEIDRARAKFVEDARISVKSKDRN